MMAYICKFNFQDAWYTFVQSSTFISLTCEALDSKVKPAGHFSLLAHS